LDDRGMRRISRTTFRSFALVGTLLFGMAVARPRRPLTRPITVTGVQAE